MTPDGVRIMAVDPAMRGAMVDVPHPTRIVGGLAKLYRVRLDGEGAALVSEVVWARMREIMAIDPACPRFLEVGRTTRPPTQTLDTGLGQHSVRIMALDPWFRGSTLEITHPSRSAGGLPKVYRLVMDNNASVVVSKVVWERVREIMEEDPTCPRFLEISTAKPAITETRPVFRHRTGFGLEPLGVNSIPKVILSK